jgi:hypothetical protein
LVEDARGLNPECVVQHTLARTASVQGLLDGDRLFVDLLLHVVAVFAALDGIGRDACLVHGAFDRVAGGIVNLHAVRG